jgi:hypothetical protein
MRQIGGRVLPIAAVVASIFTTAASQGAQMWRYEAGDMSSMYQDSIGSSPVFKLEQPVGLMLDKSKETTSAINVAPELVSANWPTQNVSWVVADGVASCSGTGTGSTATVSGTLQARKIYRAEFEVFEYVSGSVTLPYDGSGQNAKFVNGTGKYSHTFIPVGSALAIYSNLFVGKVRNVRLYEVPFTELVTNGYFDTDLSGWTPTNVGAGTSTWSAGTVAIDSGATTGDSTRIRQAVVAIAGWYEIQWTVTNWTGLSVNNRITVGSTPGNTDYLAVNIGANGLGRRVFYASAGTLNIEVLSSNASGTRNQFNLDAVTMRAVPGNHRYQPTSTARPVLSARLNLLTYSEQMDNAAWSKQPGGVGTAPVVTANQATAPDGTMTADLVTFALNGGTTSADISQLQASATSVVNGGTYTASIWMRTSDGSTVSVNLVNAAGQILAASVTPAWQRFSVGGLSSATGSSNLRVRLRGAEGTANAASLYLWGAQQVIGSAPERYQRIVAATDYDAAGFPSYLKYDGVDDCLFTPGNVDFTNTDKITVVTGIQKNSDTGAGVVFEFGPSISTADGSFAIFAPASAAPNIQWLARGTILVSTTPSGYPAPSRLVVSGQNDISGARSVIRVGGVALNNANGQGTGNYGSYPLYFGRRANASLQWNGQEYSSMGIGQKLSPDNLLTLERYTAGVTQ